MLATILWHCDFSVLQNTGHILDPKICILNCVAGVENCIVGLKGMWTRSMATSLLRYDIVILC